MSKSTMKSSLFDRVARDLPGEGYWETFAIYVGPMMQNVGNCNELSDQGTQDLIQTTLVKLWEGIESGKLQIPQANLSYWLVGLARQTASELIRQRQDA